MSTKKYCPRDDEYCTITSHHCWNDKSNNVHQSYARMMSEQSTPVLKIPLRSQETREKNEEDFTEMKRKRICLHPALKYLLRIVPIMINYCTKKSNRKKYIYNLISKNFIFQFAIILVLMSNNVLVDCAVGGTKLHKARDKDTIKEMCKNFTQGNPDKMEFASPRYGHEYPEHLTCFRTITADHGWFVRIDFRDIFNVEPPSNEGNCDYDYLEIRDGDQGYSPLIGITPQYNI